MDFPRTLVVQHYHLRPAGVRRVIETALPALLNAARHSLRRVVILTGEASPDDWEARLSQRCEQALEFVVEPSLNYQPGFQGSSVRREWLARLIGPHALVWSHNLSVGRNFGMLADLPQACEAVQARLLLHHHDWWFDNRWERVASGDFSRLAALTFPRGSGILHATLTRRETLPLAAHLPCRWLPNPVSLPTSPSLSDPTWFMPCRVLRRKNILEALLLKRWIAPKSSLAVMGQASSPVEQDYFDRLMALRQIELGSGYRANGPVAVTSLLEGFGLPFIETAAAGRPFIGRYLRNASPDIQRAGCSLPLRYREVRVGREHFDYAAEQKRQQELWQQWIGALPEPARALAHPQKLPRDGIAFSRLTLTGQLEVIDRSPGWASVQKWNSLLTATVNAGIPPIASLSEKARKFFSPEAYAERFWREILRPNSAGSDGAFSALLQQKMAVENLYPLLMSPIT